MSFTDEDLKLLKAGNMYLEGGDTDALVARLEAAENLCEYLGKVPDLKNMDWFDGGNRLFRKWLKSKGEPND